ncbi:hypothetical protein CTI14_00650 [Methylobacterium radiotolerans]|nr:hypothetical protein CTI14_00650 [Methylobacterium radiotolerans]
MMPFDAHVVDRDLWRALIALVSRRPCSWMRTSPGPRKESADRSAAIARRAGAVLTDLESYSRTPGE